jgi:hypothetical protein
MAFISDREKRAYMQNIIPDDGSVHVGFSETFDASVGFAIDEGLSTSRMLNNEMYDRRRAEAKKIFDSGVDRGKYMDERGQIDFNEMSHEFDTIEPDWKLAEQKRMLLAGRREYYNDVMRRTESTAGALLGSMTGFMLDPINVSTMAVGTPFAAAKGATMLSKILYGATGAATINVTTEALIQPFVLDYKLDIDSPYGAKDAIANLAMAAGGGFILGGVATGISGWLKRIRADADNIKITDDLDIDEAKIAVEQIDELSRVLDENPNKADIENLPHNEKVKAEAAYLDKLEEEKVRMNRTPETEEATKQVDFDDNDLDEVFRGMDEPAAIVDDNLVDAKVIVDTHDKDIAALEAMKVCMLG